MCINEKNQCRYCEIQQHVRTEFCTNAEKTGKICLAPAFQKMGNAFTKGLYGFTFNADQLCNSKFRAISCDQCHKIELEVLKTLPGMQTLYVYNEGKEDTSNQRLNEAVIDGTTQVVRFGWKAWEERLHAFMDKYAAMAMPASPSGLTDPEDSEDDSVTLDNTTPPSPPATPEPASGARLRKQLRQIQEDTLRDLNNQHMMQEQDAQPLTEVEGMIRWGDDYPILRIRHRTAKIKTVLAAIQSVEDNRALEGDLSSTQTKALEAVAARHEAWSDYMRGRAKNPPAPNKTFESIDRGYRARNNM